MNKKQGLFFMDRFVFAGSPVFFAGSGSIRSCFSEDERLLYFLPTWQGTALLFNLRRINSFDNVSGKMPNGGFAR